MPSEVDGDSVIAADPTSPWYSGLSMDVDVIPDNSLDVSISHLPRLEPPVWELATSVEDVPSPYRELRYVLPLLSQPSILLLNSPIIRSHEAFKQAHPLILALSRLYCHAPDCNHRGPFAREQDFL